MGPSNPNTDPEAVGWPSKCTWSLANRGQKQDDPHNHVKVDYSINRNMQIQDSILDCVGQTPLIRLQRFLEPQKKCRCEVLAKCEFMNPGGSVKDRIAVRMIEEAEREGKLEPGDKVIEPTSGNTGIGLAMAAAAKHYECIIFMPKKMSEEKEKVLQALGAQIYRTRTEANYNDKDSHISKAIEYHENNKRSIILNQYRNSANPLAHYDTTAEEILYACENRLDAIVLGAGTGGTITGIGRKIKERLPECKIIGADPEGSILAEPGELNAGTEGSKYHVEGIGYDFIPTVLDRGIVDKWYKTEDVLSFEAAQSTMRQEGLLIGGSSGAALRATQMFLEEFGWTEDPTKRVVVILPDGARNYTSRFLDKNWYQDNVGQR